MIHFFQCYGMERLPQKCILFSSLSVVNEIHAEEVMDTLFSMFLTFVNGKDIWMLILILIKIH